MRHLAALIVIFFVSLTVHSQESDSSSSDSSPLCFSPESKCNNLSEAQRQSYKKEICGYISKTTHCMRNQANDLSEFEQCLKWTEQIEIFTKDYLTLEDITFLEIGFNKTTLCILIAYGKADDPLYALEHLKNCVVPSFDEVIKNMDCKSLF